MYQKVDGIIIKKYDLHEFQQEAEALAKYHLAVEDMKIKKESDFTSDYTVKKLNEIEKIIPKTKLDKTVKKYAIFFKKIYNKVSKLEFTNFTMAHSDFNNENLLFIKDKLSGIIDFHNIDYAPIAKDIAIAIKRTNYINSGFNIRKMKIFLKYYQKFKKLTKKDIKMIIPALLIENTTTFWWFYLEYDGSYNEKMKAINKLIVESKKYIKKI